MVILCALLAVILYIIFKVVLIFYYRFCIEEELLL